MIGQYYRHYRCLGLSCCCRRRLALQSLKPNEVSNQTTPYIGSYSVVKLKM
jgi:hypothetical protein